MKSFHHARASSLLLVLSALSPLFAGLPPAIASDKADSSEWRFAVTPYVWACGVVGTVGVMGRKAHVDLSFSDVLGHADKTGLLAFQGFRGKQYFFFDGMYLDAADTEPYTLHEEQGALFADVDITMKRMQAAWGTRVFESDSAAAYIFVGVRYWGLTNRLTFRTASVTLKSYKDDESWIDPIVGVRFEKRLSPTLSFIGMLDAGGFGVGSDFTWEAMADFSWRISKRFSIELGYRYLYLDYEKNGFVMDTYNDGIFIGLNWSL